MIMAESAPKKPRTSEDFYLFCKFILEYENYEEGDKDGSQDTIKSSNDSTEKHEDITKTSVEDPESSVGMVTDEDSYDLVTCFCGKPFAGRPMIECSKCLTWIHLRCAKVKKSEIPDVFICYACKGNDDSN